ncbi:MAG: replicative DNA helicase [Verrucomicrobiales bacterium]|nr:replicative DNA helicase [Verrucomicrobiales bacterium]
MSSSNSDSDDPKLHSGPQKDRRGKPKIDPMTDVLRPLPSSHEMEKAVLSCMLQAPDLAVGLAAEKLSPEAFHLEAHQVLFELIVGLHDKAKPVDAVALQQALLDRGMMGKVGGPGAVGEIFAMSVPPSHLDHYVQILEEKHTLRCVITACSTCIQRAFEEQDNIEPLVDEVEERILSVRQKRQEKQGIVNMKTRVMSAIDRMELMFKNPEALQGIPTGYKDLDDMTSGLHGGDMFIIAARPSMGKTSLVMNIVEHVCVDQGKPAAVFSLEMGADQLVQRLLCARAKVNIRSLGKGGALKKGDFSLITKAGSALMKSTLIIDDTPSISIIDLRSKARRFHKTYGIQLIAIDYLQLMRSTSKRAQDNRQQEIAEISAGLKAIAKELNVPVIVLAQLNRNPEQRTGGKSGGPGGKPKLSDLRESGSIEQDADLVGLLYRPEYYANDEDERQEESGKAELLIAKHRNGATGSVPLTFLKEFMRFESRAREVGEHVDL